MDFILYEKVGQIGRITLNRPAVFNAMHHPMRQELIAVLDQCSTDETVRAVYLTGSGKAFCAGEDLQEVVDPNGPTLNQIIADGYNPIVLKIKRMEKPVVCAVNGVAAGAGANIALACDLVVASSTASFTQAFSKIGLIPDSGGTWTLPRLVGIQRAAGLMMLSDKLTAAEAASIGLIWKVFPAETFEAESWNLADTLAQLPTRGLALTKQALNHSLGATFEAQLDREDRLQTQAGATRDYKEGVAAFLEKRKPTFEGR
jgi:2-(1,2-epoxy-1,2-dihydrophenyl)acetyl-CoA isomerase